jgi:hypothetical protein
MKHTLFFFTALISTFSLRSQSVNLNWVIGAGGNLEDEGKCITEDASGNIFTTGYFGGKVDFNPSATDTFYLNSLGIKDLFVSKKDASGNLKWVKGIGGFVTEGRALGFDGNGNVYVSGVFSGKTDFNPSPVDTAFLTNSIFDRDIFILKMDSLGNYIWAKRIGDYQDDVLNTMIIDSLGNVYTSGSFMGKVDFDPNTGVQNLTSKGYENIFISKLNSNGDFVWVKQIGGPGTARTPSLAFGTDNTLCLSGIFFDTVDFDPGSGTSNLIALLGSSDVFAAKYDLSGNLIWVRNVECSGAEYASSIAVDLEGNVFAAGTFSSTADFDPSSTGTFLITPTGVVGIFIWKLDKNGSFVWAKCLNGLPINYISDLDADVTGNIYGCGYFDGTVDFDPGAGNFDLGSSGKKDIFLLKLNKEGDFVWAVKMGGSADDEPNSLKVNANKNIYATGKFNGTVDFDPGTGVLNLSSGGIIDMFELKISQTLTGLLTKAQSNCIRIYPNPSRGWLEFSMENFSANTSLKVLNSTGAIVYQQRMLDGLNKIDLSHAGKGLYFFMLYDEETLVNTQKVVIGY